MDKIVFLFERRYDRNERAGWDGGTGRRTGLRTQWENPVGVRLSLPAQTFLRRDPDSFEFFPLSFGKAKNKNALQQCGFGSTYVNLLWKNDLS